MAEKNKGGRPKGSLNKTTKSAREFAQEIIEQPEVLEKWKSQAREGVGPKDNQMPAAFAGTLMAYAYGKPTERVHMDVTKSASYEHLTDEELAQRAGDLAKQIKLDATEVAVALAADEAAN